MLTLMSTNINAQEIKLSLSGGFVTGYLYNL